MKLWNKAKSWFKEKAAQGSMLGALVLQRHSGGLFYPSAGYPLDGFLPILFRLFIVGLIFGLLFWLVDVFGCPQPLNKVLKVILTVIMVIYAISLLALFL